MATDIRGLRRQVQRLGPPTRGRRLPPGLRSELIEAVRQLREQGEAWTAIGEALGIAPETARRWWQQSSPSTALVPVRLSDGEATGGLALVSPAGYRVEGLSLEQAALLLRALP